MRRCLAVFLMLLLPLQFSWAMAAVYCQHESAPESSHYGHHEHQHGDHGTADAVPDGKLPGAVDNDCSGCHAGCVAVLSGGEPVLITGMPDSPAAAPPDTPASAPPARPERPNWHRLA